MPVLALAGLERRLKRKEASATTATSNASAGKRRLNTPSVEAAEVEASRGVELAGPTPRR